MTSTPPLPPARRLAIAGPGGPLAETLGRWLSRLLSESLAIEEWSAGEDPSAEPSPALLYVAACPGELPDAEEAERAARELGFRPRHGSCEAVRALRAADSSESGRRPETGAATPPFDDFGLDRRYIERLGKTLFRFLHDVYWRVEIHGLDHVPRKGPAVMTGVHRGFMPWDGVMAMYGLARATGRYIRFLTHPTLLKFPGLAPYMMKLGAVPANRANADRLLASGELLGVFPEGIRGAFTRYRDAYRLGRFGRQDYVRMAVANQALIVPFVTVGSAEIFPILAKLRWRWWIRFSEWPCFPITPTMGLLPLPSKWHTVYLEPLEIAGHYRAEQADDPAVVREIDREVRRRMEAGFADLLARRKHIFWGSLSPRAVAPSPGGERRIAEEGPA